MTVEKYNEIQGRDTDALPFDNKPLDNTTE